MFSDVFDTDVVAVVDNVVVGICYQRLFTCCSDQQLIQLEISYVCSPQALLQPHDVVSSVDGSDVFVVEIGPNRLWKLSSKPQTGWFIFRLKTFLSKSNMDKPSCTYDCSLFSG